MLSSSHPEIPELLAMFFFNMRKHFLQLGSVRVPPILDGGWLTPRNTPSYRAEFVRSRSSVITEIRPKM